MLNHEIGQTLTSDDDHPLGEVSYELGRVRAERRGRDENTLCGTEPDKASNKGLHIRSTHGVPGCISLRLDIHTIKAQPILVDDAVNSAIARTPELSCRVLV